MSGKYAAEASLGRQIFGEAALGDQRRTNCLVRTFDQMHRHPAGSLPAKMNDPSQLRALYRLCNLPQMTHEKILQAAREHTLRRIADCPNPVLIVHDDTELDYTTIRSLKDQMGQIGTGSRRGYICHNSLAVDAVTGETLGVMDQILHRRVKAPEKETLKQHRERSTRESLLWLRGTENLPGDPQLIDVSDRGSDTFEYLEHELRSGRRFVVRATKDRKVSAGHEDASETVKLKALVAELPAAGRFTMDVQPQWKRAGKNRVRSRRQTRKNTTFVIRTAALQIHRPHARWGNHGNDPLPVYLVAVTETGPPAGEKPLEWLLYTNEPVTTAEAAERVIDWYRKRWVVEELHKAMKTGVSIQALQFSTAAALEPAIGLLSVLAGVLLGLRDAARLPGAESRPATSLLPAEWVTVLSQWRHQEPRDFTVQEFFYALARLGGHQNRRSDHRPGWLILWRGWNHLQAMLEGYETASKQKRCGKT